MITRAVRLLHLHDIARLTQGMSAADWDDVLRQGADTADPSLWWAYPPLALVNRYYGCVPQRILQRLAAGCHWPVRRAYSRRTLSDVSLSYLWVSAFPGIEWSRSAREMSAYAVERLRPSAETRALREAFAQSQPLVSGGEWAHTSQGRRMRALAARSAAASGNAAAGARRASSLGPPEMSERQPNCTASIEIEPPSNPSIGKLTGSSSTLAPMA